MKIKSREQVPTLFGWTQGGTVSPCHLSPEANQSVDHPCGGVVRIAQGGGKVVPGVVLESHEFLDVFKIV